MKKLLTILLFSTSQVLLAQFISPFASVSNETIPVLTLSNGKYDEFFANDTLVRMGSVLFNTKQDRIERFLDEGDTVSFIAPVKELEGSRWMSVDPHGKRYTDMSPYNYVKNNPILYIDPDGRDVYIYYVTGGFGDIFGHNSIGVQLTPTSPVVYFRASGQVITDEKIEIIETPEGVQQKITYPSNEWKTIDNYVRDGQTVYRLVLKLPNEVEQILNSLLKDWSEGTDASDGQFCTEECKDALYSAFEAAGYDESKTNEYINKILPNTYPHGTPTDDDDLKKSGYSGYDKFYREDNSMYVETARWNSNEKFDQKSSTPKIIPNLIPRYSPKSTPKTVPKSTPKPTSQPKFRR